MQSCSILKRLKYQADAEKLKLETEKQFSYEEVMALKKDYERQIERLTIDVETYKRALRIMKEKFDVRVKIKRLAVIAEIREWADNNSGSVLKSENNYVPYGELLEKLDEMEAQNG